MRLIVTFVAATLLLGLLGSDIGHPKDPKEPLKTLVKPSRNNHFTHLSHTWLNGRLELPGDPPGYKKRRHDDWAVVYTLTLADGSTVRGFPCKTHACDERKKSDRVETWRLAGGGERGFERGEIKKRARTWYVSFPPGPAVLMTPGVAIWKLKFPDKLFTLLIGALIPTILLGFLDRVRGASGKEGIGNALAVAALFVASPLLLLASHGRVWFTGQVCGALMTLLYVVFAHDLRRPALAGVALGMAVACRPHVLLAVAWFGYLWWRNEERDWKVLLRFAVPLALIGLPLAWHNYARFGSITEFGHAYLDIRWQTRMQEVGQWSTQYLRRNLQCAVWLHPVVGGEGPTIRYSIHGAGLLYCATWLFAAAAVPKKQWGRPAIHGLVAVAAAIALVPLFYQNSGQLQASYRFAVDWLGFVVVALALGGAFDRWKIAVPLLLLPTVLSLYSSWHFHRPAMVEGKPTSIFVNEPRGWPFEAEFE